jgi:hypothetical protein
VERTDVRIVFDILAVPVSVVLPQQQIDVPIPDGCADMILII